MRKLLLLLFLFPSCTSSLKPGVQSSLVLSTNIIHHVQYPYLLYLPKDYSPQKSYPLVIFLHGIGESGTDPYKLTAQGLPKLIAAGRQFDFILASPQCPPDRWWHIDDLEVFLGKFLKDHPNVDRSRLYLTGLSMGGCATWDWIQRDPHTFAAAAPICGLSNPVQARLSKGPFTPVWAFHGDADPIVPVSASKDMIAAFQSQQTETRLTLYPHTGHNSWTQAYNTPELYTWLLSHHLP